MISGVCAKGLHIPFVVVENVAVLGDADILHGEGREEFWSSALGAYLIYLWECIVAEDDALGCRLQTGRVEHMVVVCKGDRCFAAAVGGESGRSTTFASITKMSRLPSRLDWKAIFLLSGLHTGCESKAAWVVSCRASPPLTETL